VNEDQELARRIALLREEHRDLDLAIDLLIERGVVDQLLLARMKRRKLALKDEVMVLETQMIPDIIA
jgi:hypothetical protein